MAMRSKDLIDQAKKNNAAALAAAFQTGDEGQVTEALAAFCGDVHDAVLEQAQQELDTRNCDNAAMAARGYHVLTSAEMSYYNKMASAIKEDPQAVVTGWNEPMPQTIIDGVIETIRKSHPLLDKLNFRNVAYMTKFALADKPKGLAAWGPITAKVTSEITGAIKVLDMTLCKLSAFMCISQDIIDLGPQWMDMYVRETLAEAIAMALETAVVTGDGKDKPIGMIMNITANHEGTYSAMEATPLTDLTPTSMGALVAKLARDPADETKARTINAGDLIFLVNPFDYWTKIMPATSFQRTDGTWVRDMLPIPADILQSAALNTGKAVLGIPSRYFVGLGTTGKNGTITRDDSVRFLEDEAAYKAKLQGDARPMDKYAFLYLDISGMKTVIPTLYQDAGAAAAAVKGK